ncbi:MAG: TetR/AcrR family transcriptional regulator [Egibacteraceae bacterium]
MAQSSVPAASLSGQDWISAALDAIAEAGVDAVAVEPLARRLGVTKGSFYWHFRSRRALVDAALAHWEQAGTEEIIAWLARIPDPRERLRHLLVQAIQDRGGGRLLAALYAVADHPQVAPVLRRVTDRRLRYLEETYVALGLSTDDARRWALHAYATYIGFHHLLRTGLADTELAASAVQLQEVLIPPAASAASGGGLGGPSPHRQHDPHDEHAHGKREIVGEVGDGSSGRPAGRADRADGASAVS